MEGISILFRISRWFLLLSAIALRISVSAYAEPIDRHALVSRHDVHVRELDPLSPLSVGNGDFAFTVDITGLQSFDSFYYDKGIPVETLSSLPWAWHSFPNTEHFRLQDTTESYPFHGRTIAYESQQKSPAGKYFRENPHPLPPGQIGLLYKGKALEAKDIAQIDQRLDLWTGVIYSNYTIEGQPVSVETVVHPERSMVAVKMESPLLARGDLVVVLRFARAYDLSVLNKPPLLWDKPEQHQTKILKSQTVDPGDSTRSLLLRRTIDDSSYFVNLTWEGSSGAIDEPRRQIDADSAAIQPSHQFNLRASSKALSFSCEFIGDAPAQPAMTFPEIKAASERAWKDYWTKGGVVDLSESTDPRAAELERRIVLSQYLMKVNYAGAFPPQESGLTHLTWYGKHNSEMYFWHAAQFYQWGHTDLLEKSLAWYQKVLPSAKSDAASKGFEGARWPKMSGIDGRPSPGGINPFIIWNFPNPIYLSELVYRSHPERATLEKYRDIVFESANFLASFAFYDKETNRYVLGPPIRSVNEQNAENSTQNPSFELAYWYFGLQLAQKWRERLGLGPDPHWADVMAKLSRLTIRDGKYVDIESVPDMYEVKDSAKKSLPSSMLMALGYLPQTAMVDPQIMRNTFDEIYRRNGLDSWVSWSMAKAAMTAARLGEPDVAVQIVTNTAPAATFLNNGHVRRPKEPAKCPAFLPVNSSFLCAIGLMVAGWDDAPKHAAPGFPQDSAWNVKWEGLQPLP